MLKSLDLSLEELYSFGDIYQVQWNAIIEGEKRLLHPSTEPVPAEVIDSGRVQVS
jgi:hypothetical protein